MVGALIYAVAYATVKYEILVVYWGFFEDAIFDGFQLFQAFWRLDETFPEIFVHLTVYPVFYAHDFTTWKYGDTFNLKDEE